MTNVRSEKGGNRCQKFMEIFGISVVGRAGKKARRWIVDLISALSSTLRLDTFTNKMFNTFSELQNVYLRIATFKCCRNKPQF